jgi:hypothetical protein
MTNARGPKKPTGFIATCVALAALAFVFALFVGMNGNPKDRFALAGIPVGLFLLWIAYAAHRRARDAAAAAQAAEGAGDRVTVGPDGTATIHLALEIPQDFPPVDMRVRPLYALFAEPQPIEHLGAWWSGSAHGYREVVGFTALGNVFLRNAQSGVYAILWPLRIGRNASTLEKCESVDVFEARFLKDREHAPVILDPIKVAALHREYGPLEPGQVYIPVPYPILAAMSPDQAPPTYQKGDFWNFINLCGQLTGKFS